MKHSPAPQAVRRTTWQRVWLSMLITRHWSESERRRLRLRPWSINQQARGKTSFCMTIPCRHPPGLGPLWRREAGSTAELQPPPVRIAQSRTDHVSCATWGVEGGSTSTRRRGVLLLQGGAAVNTNAHTLRTPKHGGLYRYGRRCDRRAPSTTAHRIRTTQSVVDMARQPPHHQSVPRGSRADARARPPVGLANQAPLLVRKGGKPSHSPRASVGGVRLPQ